MNKSKATFKKENEEIAEAAAYAADVSTKGTGAYAEAAAVTAADAATVTADEAADAVAAADSAVAAVVDAADPTLTTADTAAIAAADATATATVVTSEAAVDAVAAADIVVDAVTDAITTAANALSESETQRDHHEKYSRTDMLTELVNQSRFFEDLDRQLKGLDRYKHPAALVVIDIDDFKEVNDTLGHLEGNKLLKTIGLTIRESIRASDLAGRIGGDEFAILFPETEPKRAKEVVEKMLIVLRRAVRTDFSKVTFSAGIAGYHIVPANYEDMVKAADQLMYDVKKTGKNAVKLKIIN